MARLEPLKFDSLSSGIVEGLALPYGYGANGGIFTPRTDYAERFVDERPALTINNGYGSAPTIVGRIIDHKKTDLGIWARAQMDKSSAYWDRIKALIGEGALHLNPGVLASQLQKSASGELLRAPWVHGRLSRVAGLADVVDELDTSRNFKSAGLKVPSWDRHFEHSGLKAYGQPTSGGEVLIEGSEAWGDFTIRPIAASDVPSEVKSEGEKALALARRDLNLPDLRIEWYVRPDVKAAPRGWTTADEQNVIHIAADTHPAGTGVVTWHEARHVWQRKQYGRELVEAKYSAFEHDAQVYGDLKYGDPDAPMSLFHLEVRL